MKRLIFLILILVAAQAAHAEVSTRVCLADGNTPLELADPCIPFVYRPIMVGTHLTIIIDSDADGYWDGGELSIWDANQSYGVLSGGSKFPAAGDMATIWPFSESEEVNGQWHEASGFRFMGDDNASTGDWFIVDYNAIGLGTCSVVFYNWAVNWDYPLYEISFTHVRTRDFDDDGIVNFEDFAVLGSNWRRTDCIEPENCSGTDLDTDGDVDYIDLKSFADFWLETTR
ncbi:MAG: hypothetical protein WC454_01875 [Phycisphaerae bacterium]